MKLPKPSKVTTDQWKKVGKALAYAFVSTFITTLLLVPEISQINERAVVSALVAGVNAVLVIVKQTLTEPR